MTRERDYAYEALAEATDADQNANRGELNVALKSIREQCEIEDSYLLADEIHVQARRYRAVMGDEVLLTPTALAKHWKRVGAEATRTPRATNQAAVSDECATCDGDRFVLVATSAPTQTMWMRLRGLVVSDERSEQYAPCPDCNALVVSTRRPDGSRFVTPDAAKTRDLMER